MSSGKEPEKPSAPPKLMVEDASAVEVEGSDGQQKIVKGLDRPTVVENAKKGPEKPLHESDK